jgi:hypothetical protein
LSIQTGLGALASTNEARLAAGLDALDLRAAAEVSPH